MLLENRKMSCGATLAQSAERSSHNQYTERTQKKRYRKVARSKLAGRTIFFSFSSSFFLFFFGSDSRRARGRPRSALAGIKEVRGERERFWKWVRSALCFSIVRPRPRSFLAPPLWPPPPLSPGAAAISSSMRRVGEARNGKIKQKREGGRRKKTREGEEKLRR